LFAPLNSTFNVTWLTIGTGADREFVRGRAHGGEGVAVMSSKRGNYDVGSIFGLIESDDANTRDIAERMMLSVARSNLNRGLYRRMDDGKIIDAEPPKVSFQAAPLAGSFQMNMDENFFTASEASSPMVADEDIIVETEADTQEKTRQEKQQFKKAKIAAMKALSEEIWHIVKQTGVSHYDASEIHAKSSGDMEQSLDAARKLKIITDAVKLKATQEEDPKEKARLEAQYEMDVEKEKKVLQHFEDGNMWLKKARAQPKGSVHQKAFAKNALGHWEDIEGHPTVEAAAKEAHQMMDGW